MWRRLFPTLSLADNGQVSWFVEYRQAVLARLVSCASFKSGTAFDGAGFFSRNSHKSSEGHLGTSAVLDAVNDFLWDQRLLNLAVK